MKFLSTPSARRATPDIGGGIQDFTISIHALREEGDVLVFFLEALLHDFYPRPPRGGRPLAVIIVSSIFKFLSTPSARRATPVSVI